MEIFKAFFHKKKYFFYFMTFFSYLCTNIQ